MGCGLCGIVRTGTAPVRLIMRRGAMRYNRIAFLVAIRVFLEDRC
jgi:hypothetical protein